MVKVVTICSGNLASSEEVDSWVRSITAGDRCRIAVKSLACVVFSCNLKFNEHLCYRCIIHLFVKIVPVQVINASAANVAY